MIRIVSLLFFAILALFPSLGSAASSKQDITTTLPSSSEIKYRTERMLKDSAINDGMWWGVSKDQRQTDAPAGYRIGSSPPAIQVELPAAAIISSGVCQDKTHKEKETCQRYLVHGWISR